MRRWIWILVALIFLGGGFLYFLSRNADSQETNNEPKVERDTTVVKKKEVSIEKVKPFETNIDPTKIWEYSFGRALDPGTVTSSSVLVTDSKGKAVDVTTRLVNNNKTIRIAAPVNGYERGQTYSIDMSQELKYTNGQSVSKPYHLSFTTQRDEVEEVVLAKGLIFANKDEVLSKTKNTLTLKTSIKEDLKEGDIVVVASKEFQEGEAFKVSEIVSTTDKKVKVEVVKPEFSELFEKLNINKEYAIRAEDVTVSKDVPGISINPIALETPKTLIASTNSGDNDAEFEVPTVGLKNDKGNGFTFSLSDVPLSTKNPSLLLNGEITFKKPIVDVDADMGFLKINKFHFTQITHSESEVKVSTSLFDKEMEDSSQPQFMQRLKLEKKKEIPAKESKTIPLGQFNVPIPAFPALQIKGQILLKTVVKWNGEVEVTTNFEVDDITGIHYEKKKAIPISHTEIDTKVSARGNAKAEIKMGPAANAALYGLGVLGAGAELYGGYKHDSELIASYSKSSGKGYACGNLSYGPFVEGLVFVDGVSPLAPNKPQRLLEYSLIETNFGKLKKIDTCTVLKDIETNKKAFKLKAGDKTTIRLEGVYKNLLNASVKKKGLKSFANVRVSSSDPSVVNVGKGQDGKSIILQAGKLPNKKTASITITYDEPFEAYILPLMSSAKKVVIPVTISNFEQVQRERVNFAGQWSRNMEGLVGHLNIRNVTDNSFTYSMTVRAAGYIDKTATVNGNKAVSNPWGNCQVTFDLNNDVIEVVESDGCGEGDQIPDWAVMGTYERGAPKVSEEPADGQMFFD